MVMTLLNVIIFNFLGEEFFKSEYRIENPLKIFLSFPFIFTEREISLLPKKLVMHILHREYLQYQHPLLKEARNSFFGLGVYLLKSKFHIEGKLRFP